MRWVQNSCSCSCSLKIRCCFHRTDPHFFSSSSWGWACTLARPLKVSARIHIQVDRASDSSLLKIGVDQLLMSVRLLKECTCIRYPRDLFPCITRTTWNRIDAQKPWFSNILVDRADASVGFCRKVMAARFIIFHFFHSPKRIKYDAYHTLHPWSDAFITLRAVDDTHVKIREKKNACNIYHLP